MSDVDSKVKTETDSKYKDNSSIGARIDAYKSTYKRTYDHRAAVRAYCAGNVCPATACA